MSCDKTTPLSHIPECVDAVDDSGHVLAIVQISCDRIKKLQQRGEELCEREGIHHSSNLPLLISL